VPSTRSGCCRGEKAAGLGEYDEIDPRDFEKGLELLHEPHAFGRRERAGRAAAAHRCRCPTKDARGSVLPLHAPGQLAGATAEGVERDEPVLVAEVGQTGGQAGARIFWHDPSIPQDFGVVQTAGAAPLTMLAA
jgi:hypothetical protein